MFLFSIFSVHRIDVLTEEQQISSENNVMRSKVMKIIAKAFTVTSNARSV